MHSESFIFDSLYRPIQYKESSASGQDYASDRSAIGGWLIMPRWLLPLYDHNHELHQCSSLFSQAQTVSSDSSSVLTDSTPELTTGIKSGKGKVDGDLETFYTRF